MKHSELPYNDYGMAMRRRLGGRVQKLAIDAAMSCPHRNSGAAHDGCTFCLGEAFSPSYCRIANSIAEQIDIGIAFHASRRRHGEIYLAYLQSGTNTLAPINTLEKVYNEALSHPKVSGLIVGTRPDCISSEILDLLDYLSKRNYIAIEYGIESTYDTTLAHVNRGHDFACAQRAIELTRQYNIDIGAHFIIGLPGESREQIIAQTEHINALGIDFIKFHQLQIYRSTAMATEWLEHPERFLFGMGDNNDEYLSLIIEILRHLDPSIAVERIASTAPRHLLLHSPLSGVRIDTLRNNIVERMQREEIRQGDML